MAFNFLRIKPMIRNIALFVLIGFHAMGLTTVAVQASEGAMLIFDASRSMWGQIDGKNRIVIAREVFGEAFKRHETALKLGIMTYGSRSHSNCSDISYIRAVGRIRVKSYTKALRRINPRGKTPIARAIRLGAANLDYKNKKATLILMSDGLDKIGRASCRERV